MKIEQNEISTVHRLGRPREQGRAVIVRFCHRKKTNQIMQNKKNLQSRQSRVYVYDDMTALRAKMLNMVKEQETVKNVSTREGSIPAWLHSRGRPVVTNCPDDLELVGISAPDWKRLNLDHLTRAYDGAGTRPNMGIIIMLVLFRLLLPLVIIMCYLLMFVASRLYFYLWILLTLYGFLMYFVFVKPSVMILT